MLHKIRGSDNTCTAMVAAYFKYHSGLHELIPHKTCSFTGDGMTKYTHRSMWCCNDAVDIMPTRIPLNRWCHIICYNFKE